MARIPPPPVMPRGRIADWSMEKLGALSAADLKQLCANAQLRQETEVAARCEEILASRKRTKRAKK